jgi:RND superfamily putative drug exporter
MRRIAEFVLRHRWWVILAWLAVVVTGFALVQKTTNRLVVDFSLPGQPGTVTANQIDRDFHSGGKTSPYIVTVTLPAGQTITGHEAEVAKAFDAVVAAVPETRLIDESNTGDHAFRTRDDRTAYALVFRRFPHSATAKLPTERFRTALTAAAPPGSSVGVTGEEALEVGDSSGGNGVLAEVFLGALGALAVLAFVFASFLAFLPLVVALVSIMTTFILLLPLTYLTDVSFIVEFLVALIGLGVAIDYSLIFVNRWREERDHGRDNHDAVVVAMETAGHAVVFSGVTVAIGLLALVVLPVPFMRSIGMGGALIPLASVLTTITLTPAILGGIGPRVDWPKIRHENRASKSWSRWAQGVVRRRYLAAGLAVVVLGALFASFVGIRIGLASSASLAKSGKAYDALQTLRSGGVSTGVLTPMEVLVADGHGADVAAAVKPLDGVRTVVVPQGPGTTAAGRQIVVVIPDKETVNSATVEPVRAVRKTVDSLPGVVGVAGIGADQIDVLGAV